MLRIAVPNKGSLSEPAIELLAEAGYRTRRRGRELVLTDAVNDVELFFLRPRDIAVYVGSGSIHAGITGRDLLLDSATRAVEHRALGFARSTFRFAAPIGRIGDLREIAGKRVGASYDHLVRSYLESKGIEAEVVHLDGAVESSVRLGVADLIADVVETGSTLRAAGLEVFGDPILESEAVLITREELRDDPALATLDRRLQGVQVARSYVIVDFNVREQDLEKTIAIAPGFDSPTISPLLDSEWRAVRVMVEVEGINLVLDRLHEAGARGIIVTELKASRL
ncbi:MAG: ATP phosphoribosyltransferase [Schaalia hyovaginalis]|uniref:ATP phosphoribosyltransferase n=1 Tax=Schaalia hyovaginalis TaxID=29316 RepID=UPI0012B2DDCE|nr:ATP phosphoribosyltransferase [Schaalia hyovaginalis]MCI7672078.1 ATP phosphoribosyltransferase [Schaalia hyovaginalis]MDY4492857.1 ATP phosphoribosyltransferase [Schaalia hyovaginalis]MDY5505530.1 ATP phosphoribosyltransferase [Schaalia hyovaginalis]MDY5602066.1 ATP phosphoribosyltransferase [Schaalia hyovaginalis]MDY6213321.1 ATP phosphoribosyltransferase [Schaalia hyovaginalis]